MLVVDSIVAGRQVHPAAGTMGSHLAAEEELAAVEDLAVGEELAAVEELANVWELADVEEQTALVVPSLVEASEGAAGTARTAEVSGWPCA